MQRASQLREQQARKINNRLRVCQNRILAVGLVRSQKNLNNKSLRRLMISLVPNTNYSLQQ